MDYVFEIHACPKSSNVTPKWQDFSHFTATYRKFLEAKHLDFMIARKGYFVLEALLLRRPKQRDIW